MPPVGFLCTGVASPVSAAVLQHINFVQVLGNDWQIMSALAFTERCIMILRTTQLPGQQDAMSPQNWTLPNAQRACLDDPHISWHQVAWQQANKIPDDHVLSGHLLLCAISQHQTRRSNWALKGLATSEIPHVLSPAKHDGDHKQHLRIPWALKQ